MKLIFSRKGVDSAAGGIPSPIFPDGTFCSLPIPSDQRPRLKDIRFRGTTLGRIVQQLANNSKAAEYGVHLDPDLDRAARPRRQGWHPCFGQASAAQTHLANNEVGVGDIFLFFGWFRRVVKKDGQLIYDPGAPDIHALFGWLQVGAMYQPSLQAGSAPAWAFDHPHVRDANAFCNGASNSTLYVASHRLILPGLIGGIAGGGIFPKFSEKLQLTEPGKHRSLWRLHDSFFPTRGAPTLSYHANMDRWHKDSKGVLLSTVGRGQEFVLDCKHYPQTVKWLKGILKLAAGDS